MNKIATGLLFALGYTNAAERYIIHYDDAAWQSLHLSSLPHSTVEVFHHVQMTVADLSADELTMYENMPGVTVSKNDEVELDAQLQEDPKNWGLDRIDQRDLPLDKKFHFGAEGEGVDAYIIDTGVHATHKEFGTRAVQEKNFSGDGRNEDCHSHGTHVASTIAGQTVGIARKARVHGIKVLNCNGGGTAQSVIAGINYVAGVQKSNPKQKSIINMSLGLSVNRALNAAVKAAHDAGVVVAVSAGNKNRQACDQSPASAPEAIATSALNITDTPASFTNYGRCASLYAPGVKILGAVPSSSNDSYKEYSGTSMAAPHVAGVAALIMSSGLATTPDEVKAKMLEVSTKDHVQSNRPETANKILYADPEWTDKKNVEGSRFSFRSLNNM